MKYLNNENILNSYFTELNDIELLTEEEEKELSLKILQNDNDARNKMIEANLRFVVKIAKEYQNLGLSLSELISEGNIGLMMAVDKFDPNRDIRFASYSVWWIRQAILKALSDKTKDIRLPQNRVIDYKRIKNAEKEYLELYGCKPTIKELSSILNLEEDIIKNIKNASSLPISIYTKTNKDDEKSMLIDVLDNGEENVLDNMEKQEKINDIHNMLSYLDKRESEVLKMRFGIDGYHTMSLEDIGEIMSLTKERVRQIEKKALVHFKEEYFKYYTKKAA